jgi:hypothetical protein
MRYLSRTTVALACVAALLLALPAHAAPSQKQPIHPTPTLSAWLDALWGEISQLLAPTPTGPVSRHGKSTLVVHPQVPTTTDGGTCIDPDGCSIAN